MKTFFKILIILIIVVVLCVVLGVFQGYFTGVMGIISGSGLDRELYIKAVLGLV